MARALVLKGLNVLRVLPEFLKLLRRYPSFVKARIRAIDEAESRHQEAEDAYHRGFYRVRGLKKRGPSVADLPTTWVDNIEEFLSCCPRSRSDAPPIVYRGQTKDYFLSDAVSLSLLPALARTPGASPKLPGAAIEKSFNLYVKQTREKYIESLTDTPAEAKMFMQVATEEIFSEELHLLSKTPQGRFIRGLFTRDNLTYIYQAGLQHYGFPTLALDVTHSPLVALFFATHEFRQNSKGAFTCEATSDGGSVYIIRPNRDRIIAHPEFSNLPGANRRTFVDLFDVTWDNDSRMRRQYAALLLGPYHVDLAGAPQLNVNAFAITQVIRLSKQFWQDPGTRRFLASNLAGWFFPGPEVDQLFRNLNAADGRNFARYELGPLQSRPDPRGKYEFLELQRVVLTGPDTDEVGRLLLGSWHSRKGLISVLPVSEVMRMAADASESEPLDVVVVCGSNMEEGSHLYEKIFRTAVNAGRLFGMVHSSPIGEKIDPTPSYVTSFGGVPHIISGDPYNSDVTLQKQILDAQLLISRLRYDRRMQPPPSQWESFLPQSFGVAV